MKQDSQTMSQKSRPLDLMALTKRSASANLPTLSALIVNVREVLNQSSALKLDNEQRTIGFPHCLWGEHPITPARFFC
jgi:hypothetical protein